MMPRREPAEVTALYDGVKSALDTNVGDGRKVGDCTRGVYVFYDYDSEPIYVGRTEEQLRVRIRRHLTNQRTDAVAMSVLDPFEVAEIEMWPFGIWNPPAKHKSKARLIAQSLLYTRRLCANRDLALCSMRKRLSEPMKLTCLNRFVYPCSLRS